MDTKVYENDKMDKSQKNNPKTVQFDPMAVTWTENYSETIQKYWDKMPSSLGTIIASLAVFILGSTMRGEWLHILVHFLRAFNENTTKTDDVDFQLGEIPQTLFGVNLNDYYLKNLGYYWLTSMTISYVSYFGVGGFLHWYYYIRRRDTPEDWKCQPKKWLSPDLERHEVILGTISLTIGSTLSSIFSCYISNGGWSTLYYNINDYGWLWYFVSIPIVFIHQDYITYWTHRVYHTPFLYKNFHKLHHKYKQPTVFSVTAIHPVEFVHVQAILISPMFIYPIHWSVFVTLLMYLYYHGIIDHSGINFKSFWWQPWQPDCIFHDNHHQYFHVNFGFNCFLWDRIHGTERKKDKVYNEEIFYGKGKDIDQCTKNELTADLSERESENHLAYRGKDKQEQVLALKGKMK